MLLLLLTFSCSVEENSSQEQAIANKVFVLDSKQKVESLNLDQKFNISPTVYQDFLDKLVFEKGHLRGAYYGGVHKVLNEKQRENFWQYFGISYKNGDFIQNNKGTIWIIPNSRANSYNDCQYMQDYYCAIYIGDDAK